MRLQRDEDTKPSRKKIIAQVHNPAAVLLLRPTAWADAANSINDVTY